MTPVTTWVLARPADSLRVRVVEFIRNPLVWVWLGAIVAVFPQPWHQLHMQVDPSIDLHVYRDAGSSFLHGGPVYAHYTITRYSVLPFTYPPFAALLAIPLSLIPLVTLNALWDVAVYVVLVYVLWVVLAPVRAQLAEVVPRAVPYLLPLAWIGASYLLAIRQQVHYGQVGLFLMALIVADLLTPATGRWRGVLVGVATAIKLTPGVFIVGLWLAGRRRAAGVAAASFVLISGFTAIVAPGASRAYWTDALFDSNRLGNNADISNQSLRGVFLRTSLDHQWATALFGLSALAVAAIGFRKAVLAWREGDDLRAVVLVGLLMALLSPVAWIHHFVFVVPLIVLLIRDRRWIGATAVAVFWGWNSAIFWSHQVINDNWTALGPVRTLLVSGLGLSAALAVVALPRPRSPRP
jgi:alpha-1,2-mannosyltransferase